MRPIIKGADPPYTTKTRFKFLGANRTAITKFIAPVSGVSLFRISDCLGVVLAAVKGSLLPGGATLGDRVKAVSAIQNQVDNLYKLASVPLVQRLGPFCSYCGIPLSGLTEVEHCAPKANYPTFSTSWKNFLLSCGPCNTAKSNTPSRVTATGWTGKLNPTEDELYNEIRGMHYVWADIDDEAYDWMPLSPEYWAGTAWKKLSMLHAADTRNIVISTDISTRTVTAKIFEGSKIHTLNVRIIVESGTPSRTPDNAQETINLCNLNGVTTPQSTYDRRVMNRTLTWFTCLKSLNNLKMASGTGMEPYVWNQILMTAVASGYYSVWLWLVDYVFPSCGHKFVTDTNKAFNYPNTNTTELP